jgi:hypothetical protein
LKSPSLCAMTVALRHYGRVAAISLSLRGAQMGRQGAEGVIFPLHRFEHLVQPSPSSPRNPKQNGHRPVKRPPKQRMHGL